MVTYINGIDPSHIVLVGGYRAWETYIDTNADNALKTLGYAGNQSLLNSSYALIGGKNWNIAGNVS